MARELIKIPTTLNIEAFSGAYISTMSSYVENGIIDEFPEGTLYVTQRPGFNSLQDASVAGAGSKGRGIYYWRLVDKLYIANDTEVYAVNYSGACTGDNLASGYNKVWFAELNDDLIVVDPQGNDGYTIAKGTPTVMNVITGGAWPQNNSEFLADGVVSMDGYIFVLSNTANKDARVWNSALNDAATWTDTTNFVTAAKIKDEGVCIARHFDNIVVFGNESIEFFYNAGNATGSPLSSRDDLSYNIGCADGKSVFVDNDVIYFVGKSSSGGMAVYKMENFQLEKISNGSMDSYLTTAIALNGKSAVASGFFTGGRVFYVLTIYGTDGSAVNPIETLVYNSTSKTWTLWEHSDPDISQFPLVGWVTATDSDTSGKGILSNGDYIESLDYFYPSDNSAGTGSYAASGYVAGGYISEIASSGTEITMSVRIGHIDFGTRNRKFMKSLRVVADETSGSETLNIQYSDDNHHTLSSTRTIDLQSAENKLTRLGQFRSRNFDISYTGDTQIRLAALEVEVENAFV